MDLARYKVWVRGNIAYYPVRKAASSSLQDVIRGRPVDMREVPKGILAFSMVRNPFDRLASLYARNLDYYPFTVHGLYNGMPIQEFVDCVCDTREPQCDHHLWEANHVIPKDCEVFYFEDIDREIKRLNSLFGLNIKLPHYSIAKTNKPRFDEGQLDQLTWRYRHDLKRFYENNRDPFSCRSRGQAKARLRQRESEGADRLDSVRHRTTSTNRPSE